MRHYGDRYSERDRLLDQYARASGEERMRILAKLIVLDEEIESENAKKEMTA